MQRLTDQSAEVITFMKSSRVGGTEGLLNNFIAYIIHKDPGGILLLEPTENLAKRYSKIILDPMIRDTRIISNLITEEKPRDKKNTMLYKTFPGGFLVIAGANTPVNFRQLTVRYLLPDEIDGYPLSVGDEGDPIDLAIKRTLTFSYSKVVLVSTPTIRGISRIEASYFQSSQGHYEVPCPKCNHYQILIFSAEQSQFSSLSTGALKFDKANCTWAYYECENCRAHLTDADKHTMIERGRWRHLFPDRITHPGYHISELYAPWSKSSWLEIAKRWCEVEKRQDRLQAFINTTLGETWELERYKKIDEHELMARIERYQLVPAGVIILLISVDVQEDRLEAVVKGWGLYEESWFIDHRIIYGSPEDPKTWKSLDDYADTPWKFASGVTKRAVAIGVDSGYKTDQVYNYVRRRRKQKQLAFAFKGVGGDVRYHLKPTKNKRLLTLLHDIGTNNMKQTVFDRLRIIQAEDKTYPSCYMHFNENCTPDYFEQLTSEKRVIERNKRTGHSKIVWKLPEGKQNEALDCEVIQIALMSVLKPNMEKIKHRMDAEIERITQPPAMITDKIIKEEQSKPSDKEIDAEKKIDNPSKKINPFTRRHRPGPGKNFATGWNE